MWRHVLLVGTSALALLCSGCRTEPQNLSQVSYANRRYTVCRVDLKKQQLELFWRDAKGKPLKSFAAVEQSLRARKRKLVFAMNAGMFREDFSPVGLYVERGKQLRPLNLASGGKSNFTLKPNGVFALTNSGARVLESSRYPTIKSSTLLATQSGPMLVIEGKLHPAFRRASTSRLIRNGVGVVSAQQVIFAISEDPVNFHEFATFFRDRLGCQNALYLDGNVSSLYAPRLRRHDAWVELGPMVGVTQAAR